MDKGMRLRTPAALSIGIKVGGLSAANRPTRERLAAFQRAVIRERAAFGNDGLRLNLVFNIPGPMFQPDFDGVAVSRYDHKNQHLLVHAAVPDAPSGNVDGYLRAVLLLVRGEAHDYAARRKVRDSLDDVDAVIDHMIALLDEAQEA
jgi:hypothetical protein